MNKTFSLALTSLLLTLPLTAKAGQECQISPAPKTGVIAGEWIRKENWLDPEYRPVASQLATAFMPGHQLSPGATRRSDEAPPELPGRSTLPDPLDQQSRSIEFLLDARLSAAGVLVMQQGQIVAERYRRGLRPEHARLLFEATRPLLNAMGAAAIAQGRLSSDKSVARSLPPLAQAAGLRKLSIQRLLNGNEKFTWTDEEIASWRTASGWQAKADGEGLRSWLAQTGRWSAERSLRAASEMRASPEDDLLAWLLTENPASGLARQLCEQLLPTQRLSYPALWLEDPHGAEIANGLALSLRDFAMLGQILLEARNGRSRIPNWFIETLTASSGLRHPEIPGLPGGSEVRYGFYRLGGKGTRIALLGGHGDSLYIDFDRRLVIAIFADHPAFRSPTLLATLDGIWQGIASQNLKPAGAGKKVP